MYVRWNAEVRKAAEVAVFAQIVTADVPFLKRAVAGAGAGAGNSQTTLRIANYCFLSGLFPILCPLPPHTLPPHYFAHTVFNVNISMRVVASELPPITTTMLAGARQEFLRSGHLGRSVSPPKTPAPLLLLGHRCADQMVPPSRGPRPPSPHRLQLRWRRLWRRTGGKLGVARGKAPVRALFAVGPGRCLLRRSSGHRFGGQQARARGGGAGGARSKALRPFLYFYLRVCVCLFVLFAVLALCCDVIVVVFCARTGVGLGRPATAAFCPI